MKKALFIFFMIFAILAAGCTETSDIESESSSSEDVSAESSGEVSEEVSEDSSEVSQEVSQEQPPEKPKEPENLNLLTGIADLSQGAIGKRPVAVMVNNVTAAMPQYGIEDADIIFEIPVEGYQTRLMCIYGDYTELPFICSVRSCRKYFPALARGFNAVYVNCGQNSVINDYVDSLDVNQYDGRFYGKELFDRDQDRLNAGYAKEHTLYFNGPYFPTQLENDNVDMNLEESKTGVTAFKFNGADEQIAPIGDACVDIYIDFGSNESGFVYNQETKTYFKTYYNKKQDKVIPQCDDKTGNQLQFTNVFVLHNEVAFDKTAVYNDKGDMHRLIKWQGGTDSVGYYISNGVKQEIYWIKDSEADLMRFFDKDGNEISVNRGKSYICFTDTDDVEFQ